MKDLKISKELLSEVLNLNITYIERCNNSIIYKISVYDREEEINIYELAHKCKEWAYTQGYILFSKIRLNSSLASCYFDTMGKHDYEDGYHNDFRAESEPEAIFKACDYILKELSNK